MIWMLHEIAKGLACGIAGRYDCDCNRDCNRDYDQGQERNVTESNDDNPLLTGLEPVHDDSARVLVLGSMPGARSLDRQAYYAHPRNAFWPIMESLFGICSDLPYQSRLAGLREHRVALWDVIGRCRRRGSLDQKVEPDSIVPNDFGHLFCACPSICLVAFNGRLAEQSFERHVVPDLPERFAQIERVLLPSTSPAHAAMRFEHKCAAWARELAQAVSLRRPA